jgi:hypothetical protein
VGDADGHGLTSAQEIERELARLAGLLEGIALDGRVLPVEIVTLREWCAARRGKAASSPFREVVARLEEAISDGVLDEEERADILWLCDRARSPGPFWTVARSDMERLHGVLAGIGADRRVTGSEIGILRTLLASCEHLRGTWPYDELEAVLARVLADGKVDEEEHRLLVAFTRSFLDDGPRPETEQPLNEQLVRFGVCAVRPRIEFPGRRFCVTGSSPRSARTRIARAVAELGGVPVLVVARDVDYLVVDAPQGVAWAFSAHGRKVEAALALRQQGAPLTIVRAEDFWDAAAERGVRR